MDNPLGRVFTLAASQRDLVAVWQMKRVGLDQSEISAAIRSWRKVHRGVYALSDLDERGWLMAATLIAPGVVVSHGSALALLGLRPPPAVIHVTWPKRSGVAAREGLVIHRPRRAPEVGTCDGIPVTSPTQSLLDARLPAHELYRALEEADRRSVRIGPAAALEPVARLRRRVRGRTRSDAEARFVLLCEAHGLELPLVNHRLNGFETDFHWPHRRVVVEVDGFEYHRERAQFEEDRRRGLVHRGNGFEVLRVSALQVEHQPLLVARAVARALRHPSAQARGRSTGARRRPT